MGADDAEMSLNTVRRLLGDKAAQLSDDEIGTFRDGATELAGVIADAHADIIARSEVIGAELGTERDWLLVAALGLSAEEISEIDYELDLDMEEEYGPFGGKDED